MARLRLFANLREVAGTSTTDVAGTTVGAVLESATAMYGSTFGQALSSAKVWVNGEPAGPDTPVNATDEVAVIPPVSGGKSIATDDHMLQLAISSAIIAAIVIATFASIPMFSLVIVGASLAWLWDLTETAAARSAPLNPISPMIAAAAAVTGAYAFGFSGFAVGLVIGVGAMLGFGVFNPADRELHTVAATGFTVIVVALGAGSAILIRLRSREELIAFLIIALLAGGAAYAVSRYGDALPAIDPNAAVFAGAVIAGFVGGLILDNVSLPTMLIAAAATAAGMIAGRTFGALMRAGDLLATRPPGALTALDGPFLGVAMFWIAIAIFG